jgi:hypothetical protein
LTTCMATRCETECGLTCGGIASADTAPDAAVACQACFQSSSSTCASERACASSADCVDWLQCSASCSTPDCWRACDDLYGLADAGFAGTASYLGITPPQLSALATSGGVSTCGTACALGSDWACVSHVHLPTATTGATTLETQVLDGVSTKPVTSGEVLMCRFGDPTCNAPLARGLWDPNGFVTVTVPPPSNAIDVLGVAPASRERWIAPWIGRVPWHEAARSARPPLGRASRSR